MCYPSLLAALVAFTAPQPFVGAVTLGASATNGQDSQHMAMEAFRHSATRLGRALARELVGGGAWNQRLSPADRAKLVQSARERLGHAAMKFEASDSEAAGLLQDWAQEAPPSALIFFPFNPPENESPSEGAQKTEDRAGFAPAEAVEKKVQTPEKEQSGLESKPDVEQVTVSQAVAPQSGPQETYSSYSRSTVVSNDGNHATTHIVECRNGKCKQSKKDSDDVPGALKQGLKTKREVDEQQLGALDENEESSANVDNLALALAKDLKHLRSWDDDRHWFGFAPLFSDPWFEDSRRFSHDRSADSRSIQTSTVMKNGRATTQRTECVNGNCQTSKSEGVLDDSSPERRGDEVAALASEFPYASPSSKDEMIRKLQQENALLRSKLDEQGADSGETKPRLRRGKP